MSRHVTILLLQELRWLLFYERTQNEPILLAFRCRAPSFLMGDFNRVSGNDSRPSRPHQRSTSRPTRATFRDAVRALRIRRLVSLLPFYFCMLLLLLGTVRSRMGFWEAALQINRELHIYLYFEFAICTYWKFELLTCRIDPYTYVKLNSTYNDIWGASPGKGEGRPRSPCSIRTYAAAGSSASDEWNRIFYSIHVPLLLFVIRLLLAVTTWPSMTVRYVLCRSENMTPTILAMTTIFTI